MKRILFFTVVALVLHSAVWASDYSISKTVSIPSLYYVGDQVELRLTLRTAYASKLEAPKDMPKPTWGTIQDIRVLRTTEEEPEVRIFFTAFASGTRTLPPVNLGPIVLTDINIFVTSLLEENSSQSLAGPREQALLPGTALLLAFQILILLLIPATIVLLLVRGKPFLFRMLAAYREGIPYRRLQKSLKYLGSEIESIDAKTFYIRILDETRAYLTDRLHMSAMSATTRELESLLSAKMANKDDLESLIELFRHGDLVKFAKEPATLQIRLHDFHALEVVLHGVEQAQKLLSRESPAGLVSVEEVEAQTGAVMKLRLIRDRRSESRGNV